MALESATYINGLVSANPPAGDPVSQADDHIRLIKAVLKSTFPNLTGAVTPTAAQMNLGLVPTGAIMAWYGSVLTIPTGWALCDGGTYVKSDASGNIVTPDLRDKFLMGSGSTFAVAAAGGSLTPGGTTSSNGGFTPAGSLGSSGAHTHGGLTGSTVLTINQIPAHTHSYTYSRGPVGASGGGSRNYADDSVAGTTGSAGGGLGHDHSISSDGSHTHTFTGTAVAGHTHTVTVGLPAYLALAYIMKL